MAFYHAHCSSHFHFDTCYYIDCIIILVPPITAMLHCIMIITLAITALLHCIMSIAPIIIAVMLYHDHCSSYYSYDIVS